MSVSQTPPTSLSRVREVGAAVAWLASGGGILFVLFGFGPTLIDAFAHGNISWLRSLIVAVILSSADVSAILLIFLGLRRLWATLMQSTVGKTRPQRKRPHA